MLKLKVKLEMNGREKSWTKAKEKERCKSIKGIQFWLALTISAEIVRGVVDWNGMAGYSRRQVAANVCADHVQLDELERSLTTERYEASSDIGRLQLCYAIYVARTTTACERSTETTRSITTTAFISFILLDLECRSTGGDFDTIILLAILCTSIGMVQ